MHEMSICQSIVDLVSEQARQQAFERVTRIRLEIGCFAGVEPQALAFGFDVSTRGTVADGATLEIIDIPGKAWCFECSASVEISDYGAECPFCGGGRIQVIGGNELRIRDMEVM